MIFAKSHVELHNIRANVERVKKLSDNVVGVGPFGVGLDGLLTWIPGAGELYSLGAGGLIVLDAVRARAAPMVIIQIDLLRRPGDAGAAAEEPAGLS